MIFIINQTRKDPQIMIFTLFIKKGALPKYLINQLKSKLSVQVKIKLK